MELTEKCKINFEKWYFKKHCKTKIKYEDLMPHHKKEVFGWFYNLHITFKYGVYLDYFDSEGIQIYSKKVKKEKYSIYIDCIGHHLLTEYIYKKTPIKAMQESIKNANKIYNKNSNYDIL